jgi:hypothetical protein
MFSGWKGTLSNSCGLFSNSKYINGNLKESCYLLIFGIDLSQMRMNAYHKLSISEQSRPDGRPLRVKNFLLRDVSAVRD